MVAYDLDLAVPQSCGQRTGIGASLEDICSVSRRFDCDHHQFLGARNNEQDHFSISIGRRCGDGLVESVEEASHGCEYFSCRSHMLPSASQNGCIF